METIRTFIAVELPASVKDAIAGIQSELKKTKADVKWVRPANCHITLKFLGNITREQADAVSGVLRKCADGCVPFRLTVENPGAFPSLQKPNIIWLGLADAGGCLSKMAAQVEEQLSTLGFAREDRAFTPHITIGRTKPGSHRHLSEALKNARVPSGLEFTARGLTLFQSVLSSEGPAYSVLKECLFG
jgi:RNA 2',3'-cyclic 3'-phosphodiesterase